jgi:thiol-disulfide isomerase/thioredoxin
MSHPVQDIPSEAEFDRLLAEAGRPVLVEFYKGGGCPTCLVITPIMKRLAEEYAGRVVVARMELMKPWFAVAAPALRERYDIALLFPTVILFVGGEARKRWILNYRPESYRRALDKALSA